MDMIGKVRKLKDGDDVYTYPITVAEAVYVESNQTLKEKLAEIEERISENSNGDGNGEGNNGGNGDGNGNGNGNGIGNGSRGSYTIELSRWNIDNDGTNAESTSRGINDALAWAAEEGITEVIFPKGTYLIDEHQPVKPHSRTTLNLNGSTLKIRSNAQEKYAVILLDNAQQYVKITNGIIEGDRYTHDYSSGSTHEFGIGVHLEKGVSYISLEHLDIYDTTGDAVIAIASYGGIGGPMPRLAGNMEPGGIDAANGALTNETNRIRSKVNLPMDVPLIRQNGYFGLYGDSYGGLGREITTDLYDVIFYDRSDQFVASKTQIHFFDEVEVPSGASYAKVVLRQGTVPSPEGNTVTVRSPEFPKYVFIEKCSLHDCRRLGVAVAGAKHLYVKECAIYSNKGIAPQGGIDVEDAYDLNQYIHIDGNDIYDNGSYNIIIVNGRHITITNNRIQDEIFTVNRGVDKAVVSGNYFAHAGPRISGDTVFSDNHLYACRTLVNNSPRRILINNCYFHNSPINMGMTTPYALSVLHCHFYFDNDFTLAVGNLGSPLIFSGEPQTISHCIFEGHGAETFSVVLTDTAGGWVLAHNTFNNTIHPQNRIMILPAGTYTGCSFIDSGRLAPATGPGQTDYEFHQCTFRWSGYTLLQIGANPAVPAFRFSDNAFTCTGSETALQVNGSADTVQLLRNRFNYNNSASSPPMVQFANTVNAKQIHIIGNDFTAGNSKVAVKADAIPPAIPLLFKDNILIQTTTELRGNHIQINNFIDGVMR